MRDAEAVGEARTRWRRKMIDAGKCTNCGEAEATNGDRCDGCADKNRASARASHRRTYTRRSAVGLDGKRHYRCKNCQGLGHQAKTCHELPAVTVDREGDVVRLACQCGDRAAGLLRPWQVKRFRMEHAGHGRRRKVLANEQFDLFASPA